MSLKIEEYVPYAPDRPGVRTRVNHSSDSCGGDSQSLSIWRNDDDTIGAKCYRCGQTGRTVSKKSMFESAPKTENVYELPTDVTTKYSEMPPEVAMYLNSNGITEFMCHYYDIGWSESAGGLVFPVHNELGHDGFQVKYFGRKQRYTTVHRGRRELMFSHLCSHHDVVVVVEDLLSAIRVNEATPFDAFALLGSELNDHGLAQLVKHHQEFIVWLDNDNDIVVGKAKALFNRLSLFGSVRLVKDQVEPKDLSDIEITNKLIKNFNK